MSCFFVAVVPLLLYASFNQAAPMVKTDFEGQIASASLKLEISVPDANSLQPSSSSVPKSSTTTVQEQKSPPVPQTEQIPQQTQCPPDTVSLPECPPCSDPQPDQAQTPAKPQAKKNCKSNLKKLLTIWYKATTDFFADVLAKIVTTTGQEYTKERKKAAAKSSATAPTKMFACCINVTKEPEQVNEEEENPPVIQLPPISFSSLKSKITVSVPGVPDATSEVPLPGSKTVHETNTVNCCCVGKDILKCNGTIRTKIKSQLNCCAITVNGAVVEN